MADENISGEKDKNPLDSRLADLLSDKANLSKEVEAKDKTLQETAAKLATLEKENTFNSGFADIVGTRPMAKDHKDEIKAKVMSGYSVEDATFAVLGKAGKLGVEAPRPDSPAGGSATNAIPQDAVKSPAEMTQTERREALSKELIWA